MLVSYRYSRSCTAQHSASVAASLQAWAASQLGPVSRPVHCQSSPSLLVAGSGLLQLHALHLISLPLETFQYGSSTLSAFRHKGPGRSAIHRWASLLTLSLFLFQCLVLRHRFNSGLLRVFIVVCGVSILHYPSFAPSSPHETHSDRHCTVLLPDRRSLKLLLASRFFVLRIHPYSERSKCFTPPPIASLAYPLGPFYRYASPEGPNTTYFFDCCP